MWKVIVEARQMIMKNQWGSDWDSQLINSNFVEDDEKNVYLSLGLLFNAMISIFGREIV